LLWNLRNGRSYYTLPDKLQANDQITMAREAVGILIWTAGVRFTICHQVKRWMEPGTKSAYNPIDPMLKKAIEEQEDIGWRQFIRGRLAITWGALMNTLIQQTEIPNNTAEIWGMKLVQLNWQYIRRLWHTQNKELHGVTMSNKTVSATKTWSTKFGISSKNIRICHWRLIDATEERMKVMSMHNLATFAMGAKFLARNNIKRRTANLLFERISQFHEKGRYEKFIPKRIRANLIRANSKS
jgi:hypothetical protein